MGRLFKIIMYVVVLVFLYIMFSTVYESCSKTSDDMMEKAKDGVENVAGQATDAADELNDEFFSDDDGDTYGEEDDGGLADDLFDDTASTDVQPTATKPSRPTPTPASTSKPKPRPSYSNTGGKYMVIAGNFLVEGNASNMVNKLRNLGYEAESVVFDESQYYTVLANRTDDYNNALSVSSRLKSEGVDNYVKTQKY